MKRTKELHSGWVEFQSIPKELQKMLKFGNMFGKWHYHYENKNGVIGLIKIKLPLFSMSAERKMKFVWEACGVLEYSRFATKKEAEIEIYKALKEPILNK